MPNVKKAELLEGVVHMPSPVRHTHHGLPHGLLARWLGDYVRATPGAQLSIGATLRLVDENEEPQPDLVLFVLPPSGTARIDAEGYLVGPPELVVEVAASSAASDLDQKLRIFRRAGVSEYLVVRVEAAAVDWFVLRHGTCERLPADPRGILRSEVFPGLWLDGPALRRCRRAFAPRSTPRSAHDLRVRPHRNRESRPHEVRGFEMIGLSARPGCPLPRAAAGSRPCICARC